MSELKVHRIIGLDERCARVDNDYYLKSEADKVIAELKADYKEACDRLQTANLIKDEQLAATRHQKYKRCLAMAWWCELEIEQWIEYSDRWQRRKKWLKWWLELAEKFKDSEH